MSIEISVTISCKSITAGKLKQEAAALNYLIHLLDEKQAKMLSCRSIIKKTYPVFAYPKNGPESRKFAAIKNESQLQEFINEGHSVLGQCDLSLLSSTDSSSTYDIYYNGDLGPLLNDALEACTFEPATDVDQAKLSPIQEKILKKFYSAVDEDGVCGWCHWMGDDLKERFKGEAKESFIKYGDPRPACVHCAAERSTLCSLQGCKDLFKTGTVGILSYFQNIFSIEHTLTAP